MSVHQNMKQKKKYSLMMSIKTRKKNENSKTKLSGNPTKK